VKKAEQWQWSSVWRREQGSAKQQKILAPWLVTRPKDYLTQLNKPLIAAEEEVLERSEAKSIPFGKDGWVNKTAKKYGIEQVLKRVGRPRNGG
jgi:hypothetical protein